MRDERIPWIRGFIPGAVLFVSVQALLVAFTGWPAATGEFWGPDSYMRLERTLACWGGSACPSGVVAGTNAPFGEVIHWPFLQDRLLLAGAAPLAPFFGWHDATLIAASFFSPTLAIGAIALVLLAARTLVPRPGLFFVGLLLASQPWVFQAFAAPRVDHHGLQGFLFLGMMAGALHILVDRGGERRWAAITGAALGLALWVSTEALVTSLPVLLGLALLWAIRGGRDTARANRDVALSLVAVLTLGLLVDGPPGEALAPVYDRFSIVHWTLFSLIGAFWWTVERFHGEDHANRRAGIGRRILVGGGGVAVVAAVVGVVFPEFFGGPMVEMDPRLRPIWLDHIREFRPVVSSGGAGADGVVSVVHLASFLIGAPLAMACSLWGHPDRRGRWLLVAGALLWFGGLAVFLQGRWALYLHLLVPIPLGFLLGRVVDGAQSIRPAVLRAAVHVGSAVLIALLPFLFAVPLVRAEGERSGFDEGAGESCSASALVPFLRDLEMREGAGILLAPADWGSEVVFRTGHRTVASPYHRNASGLLDSYDFMTARNAETSRGIAVERGIAWVVVCDDRRWFPIVAPDAEGTFYEELSEGGTPEWLRSVALPASLGESVSFFKVDLEKSGGGRP